MKIVTFFSEQEEKAPQEKLLSKNSKFIIDSTHFKLYSESKAEEVKGLTVCYVVTPHVKNLSCDNTTPVCSWNRAVMQIEITLYRKTGVSAVSYMYVGGCGF